MAELRDRVIAQHVELDGDRGRKVSGALEYFPGGHALALTDDIERDPFPLTATAAEAPEVTARLEDDQVLLTDYVVTRGVPASLAKQGFVELLEPVKIGVFGLDGHIARVL